MADLHPPVVVLTAGFPRLSMDPSSVMGDVHFESIVVGSISLSSEFSEPCSVDCVINYSENKPTVSYQNFQCYFFFFVLHNLSLSVLLVHGSYEMRCSCLPIFLVAVLCTVLNYFI